MFERGKIYNRRKDIHTKYSGNPQSGISICAKHNMILIFTGPRGKEHGYQDHWVSDQVYQYTGEGKYGDMEFARGNKAIRDHVKDGRSLHLFEQQAIGYYKYICELEYMSHVIKVGDDTDGTSRRMILFNLQRV